jgi:hypothetical protein
LKSYPRAVRVGRVTMMERETIDESGYYVPFWMPLV